MTLATVGAFVTGENSEAVAVMLFYQVGEWFQSYAVGKSRRSITELMDIAPDFANVERADGSIEEVDPEEVQIGDTLVIRAGEKIPVDGTVLEGQSMVNTSALTGESVPRSAVPGDQIISGCINGEGLLKIRAEKSTRIQPWLRFWSWWKTRPPRSRRRRISSPGSLGTIRQSWWPVR